MTFPVDRIQGPSYLARLFADKDPKLAAAYARTVEETEEEQDEDGSDES